MATLNLSTNGPSITKSYQTVVDATLPQGSSPTYGQWAVYSVSAPLASAFQLDTGKESILKVQSTGDGELVDLIEEFSDGRIQFAFVKVKDPNTTLPKSVLIAWCGAGVPERTKGYFGSHLSTVAKLLRGYHVQVTARSDSDLSPEGIVQKVADASGSKYTGDSSVARSSGPPPVASKPVFTPTSVVGGGSGFNPLQSRSRASGPRDMSVDDDGWGADAPPVTRTELEKVKPAYQPTKVDMGNLTSQRPEASRFNPSGDEISNGSSDVVKGTYQPVGKVDIAALRRQAQASGNAQDDRPTVVKGAYEPVGKVDIAAIRSRAQPSSTISTDQAMSLAHTSVSARSDDQEEPKSLADRSAAFQDSGRLTTLPKPRVANKFGSGTGTFTGTKAPTPGGFESKPVTGVSPVGTASRTFADEDGKTPAQVWAERKARQRGSSGAADTTTSQPQVIRQTSGGSEWKSGYSGKTWAPVETVRPGVVNQQVTGEDMAREDQPSPSGGVGAIRDRFQDVPPMTSGFNAQEDDAPPPPLASKPSTRPGGGVAIPGMSRDESDEEYQRVPSPPAQPPRSATPPTPPAMREGSPIRIVQPVARGKEFDMGATDEHFSPPMPAQSMSQSVPQEDELDDEEPAAEQDPARSVSQAAAALSLGGAAVSNAPGAQGGGKRALVQYDYEKAEDNELELKEGEYVTNIDMVDEDWWMGENSKGETGLFPSNYVELVDDQEDNTSGPQASAEQAAPAPQSALAASDSNAGQTATAQYDYEAAEENELSFPDGAKITNVEFPDEDWWFGEYGGKSGLFPANYVQIDE